MGSQLDREDWLAQGCLVSLSALVLLPVLDEGEPIVSFLLGSGEHWSVQNHFLGTSNPRSLVSRSLWWSL